MTMTRNRSCVQYKNVIKKAKAKAKQAKEQATKWAKRKQNNQKKRKNYCFVRVNVFICVSIAHFVVIHLKSLSFNGLVGG